MSACSWPRTLAALAVVFGSLVAAPTSASAAGPSLSPPAAKTAAPTGTVVAIAVDKATSVSSGYAHTCAVTTTGKALCWGFNADGQLGDGTTTTQLKPVGVSGLSSKVASISAGETHSCAVTTKGKALCWGYNGNGQLGDNTTVDSHTPAVVYGMDTKVKSISAGWVGTCAVKTSGKARCWGDNSAGQLGNGTTIGSVKPVTVSGLTSGVKSVSVGLTHACALKTSGKVVCWGYNAFGQLGDGTTATRLTPVTVHGLTKVTSISVGIYDTCATRSTGKAVCWGLNNYGQLGDGTTTNSFTPVTVTGFSSKASVVKTGVLVSCVIKTSGTSYCWGHNGDGQVGDNTNTDRLTPVKVFNLGSTKKISVGSLHTCAVTSSKSVKCWGSNTSGQLGNNSTTGSKAPVEVYGF
ncbi:MAG: biotin transporter BioY [Actinobacteria bacterium]|nr:biotin transporter BioY [Actinomycetota bacterium]